MIHWLAQKTGIVAIALLLFCCKARIRNAPVFFSPDNKAVIHFNSSCRNSGLSSLSNETELKRSIMTSSEESIRKYKLKTTDISEKANYHITQTTLTITEKCGDKTNGDQPQIGLQHVLTLENTLTKELQQFRSDTVVVNQASLAQPASVAQKKTDLDPYIRSLTQANYARLKKHFGYK